MYGYFKQQTGEVSHEKTWTWLRNGTVKRETESIRIEAQNNAIRTKYVKTKLDKTQPNSKRSSCSYRDKTINHIISE